MVYSKHIEKYFKFGCCCRLYPVPETPPAEKISMHTPKDIAYISSPTSRLTFQDITEDEADNLYLLLKIYQALRAAALKGDKYFRQQAQDAVKPGLKELLSWYQAIEKELKKNNRREILFTHYQAT